MGKRVWGLCQGISTAGLYGSLALFVSILHNVFLLYYVETFVSVYKIDKLSFWVGEVGLLNGIFNYYDYLKCLFIVFDKNADV